jgi:4-hydroxy-3-polyprenylbenzoate decarboxylase
MPTGQPPFVIGISGASGAVLAEHAIETLMSLGHTVHLTASHTSHDIWLQETGRRLEHDVDRWTESGQLRYFRAGDYNAPIASGSFPTRGMIIIPCSTSTVGALAAGLSTNLLQRAADCCIKEGRRLVIVPRETPLSAVHLENLLRLARLGVFVVPPLPAFYTHPQTVEDIVAQITGRALLALGVPEALEERFVWRGRSPRPEATA